MSAINESKKRVAIADRQASAHSATQQAALLGRFRTGASWNLLAAISNQGATFAANVLTSNLLGQSVFGEFTAIQSTHFVVYNIAQIGAWLTASKFVAQFRSTEKEKAGRLLGLCCIASGMGGAFACLLLIAGAPWMASVVLANDRLAPGLMIAAVSVVFSALNMYQTGALAGLECYKGLASAGIFSSVSYLAASIVGARWYGLYGALTAVLLRVVLQWTMQQVMLREATREQGIRVDYRNAFRERSVLWSFCLPATVSGGMSWAAVWLATTFLVRQPGGYVQMALFSAANMFRLLVLFLPFTVIKFLWPILNHQRGVGNEGRWRRVFWLNLLMAGGIVVFGAGAACLIGPHFLWIFGKDFDRGYWVLVAVTLSAIPEALTIATQSMLQSREKVWSGVLGAALPRDITIVVLSYYLCVHYGALGLGMAFAVGWTLALVANVVLIQAGQSEITSYGNHSVGLETAASQTLPGAYLRKERRTHPW